MSTQEHIEDFFSGLEAMLDSVNQARERAGEGQLPPLAPINFFSGTPTPPPPAAPPPPENSDLFTSVSAERLTMQANPTFLAQDRCLTLPFHNLLHMLNSGWRGVFIDPNTNEFHQGNLLPEWIDPLTGLPNIDVTPGAPVTKSTPVFVTSSGEQIFSISSINKDMFIHTLNGLFTQELHDRGDFTFRHNGTTGSVMRILMADNNSTTPAVTNGGYQESTGRIPVTQVSRMLMQITAWDATNPPTQVEMFFQSDAPPLGVWRQEFIDELQDQDVIRSLDLLATNDDFTISFEQVAPATFNFLGNNVTPQSLTNPHKRGLPWRYFFDLCHYCNAHPWLNIPGYIGAQTILPVDIGGNPIAGPLTPYGPTQVGENFVNYGNAEWENLINGNGPDMIADYLIQEWNASVISTRTDGSLKLIAERINELWNAARPFQGSTQPHYVIGRNINPDWGDFADRQGHGYLFARVIENLYERLSAPTESASVQSIELLPVVASQAANPNTTIDMIAGIRHYGEQQGMSEAELVEAFFAPSVISIAGYHSDGLADSSYRGVPIHSPTLQTLGYASDDWLSVEEDIQAGVLDENAFFDAWLDTLENYDDPALPLFSNRAVIRLINEHLAIALANGMATNVVLPLQIMLYEAGSGEERGAWRNVTRPPSFGQPGFNFNFTFAEGDVSAVEDGIVSASGAFDPAQLPVGEWLLIGSRFNENLRFDNAENLRPMQIVAVTPNRLTLSPVGQGWAPDPGAGKTIYFERTGTNPAKQALFNRLYTSSQFAQAERSLMVQLYNEFGTSLAYSFFAYGVPLDPGIADRTLEPGRDAWNSGSEIMGEYDYAALTGAFTGLYRREAMSPASYVE